jgi:hypothetical protein
MYICTPNNYLIISCIDINITFLNKLVWKSLKINLFTNSSCSLTKRSFRALPRSDRARDGVDIGVRPLGYVLLCAGDVVNVIGENAIPKERLPFYINLSLSRTNLDFCLAFDQV